ncbi:MAG TPA: metallophosphoesterase [Brevundimonas sp.]|jgi:serine/threonine protein phosphatase 1|uniref:metallophosphoesterase n=1 Tax=Brevundimonas sp. TaxID=1871086 RepID=UPI002DEE87F5|nr:metallophosphoesterase [Brevundimonas sp.]
MFGGLFRKSPPAATPATDVRVPRAGPDGAVVWAIGDVHGCLDLLDGLLQAIIGDADVDDRPRTLIFLGDYVDRGPDSRGVVDRLIQIADMPDVDARFIRGNHEDKMHEFLDDPSVGATWCEYGGDAALASYGLQPPAMRHRREGWVALSADLSHKLGPRGRRFLEQLEPSVTLGGYFFCHAGALPGVPLDQQAERDLMWIRGRFLNDDQAFDRVVVHGHTPTDVPHVDHRRIGVDTGAYATGVLTALRIDGRHERFVQAVRGTDGQVTIRDWTAPAPAPTPVAA